MDIQPKISAAKRVWATGLGVITVLYVVGLVLSFVVMSFELKRDQVDGPPFYPGIIFVAGFILTFPVAIICTCFAVSLVGYRNCKLAWISLIVYCSPILLVIFYIVAKKAHVFL